ncbi:hypothetical protein [Flavobacterium sp. UBA7663]|uniref:hypothetical protein n=1 Tax=Flavobacterium sp. UBA7663 TaxID=1946557 RepID=UPI0025C61B5A|nr:hypothetical protein [Flavobacterium sp. UBA7663]
MKHPFNLDEGIFFEDTGKMILWESDFEALKKIDEPTILNNGNTLKWFGKSVLGNQKLNITVSKSDYDNVDGKFNCVEFETENEDSKSIHLTAETYSKYFNEIFGEPTESRIEYERLTELWDIEDLHIIIGIGERFMEFLIFSIRKGKKYWKLV